MRRRPALLACALSVTALLSTLVAAAPPGNALNEIRQSGVIRMGYLEAAPPFSFDQAGAPAGYSVDLCRHVAEGIGHHLGVPDLRVEWVKLTQQNRLDAVQSGRVQVECGTTTWTFSRQEKVDFSLMTFIDGGTVLVRADSLLMRLDDFAGKRIAVMQGTTTERNLAQALKRHTVAAEVATVTSPEKALAMLKAGQVDGFASDRVVLLGLGLSNPSGGDFRLLDEDFSVEPYALVLPRAEPDLRLAVNRALAALYRSGQVEEIFQRWLGPLGSPSVLLTALFYLQSIPE
jgi:glutamate/aspartate transport system substrate-binding protein